MSFIKTFRLLRVDASLSGNDPLQWSENGQLALNGYNQITLLEPKLPSLYQTIQKVNDDVIVLDPKYLFQLTTILDGDSTLPLGNFNNLTFASEQDEPFTISNIFEYVVVSHQWTSTFDTSRDNLLGVLFNTGEFLVLGRKNFQTNKYFVFVNMFEVLADQFGVEKDNDKYVVDANEMFALKVKSFHFSTVGSTLLVSIVNGNNSLLVYKIDQESYDLELLASIDNSFRIIKQKWSNWNDGTSFITVVSPENSLHTFKLTYDNNELTISESTLAIQPSRFKLSQLEYVYYKHNSILVSTFTGKLILIDSDQKYEYTLDTYTTCVSITSGIIEKILTLILAFENGTFTTVQYDLELKKIELVPTDKSLASFVDSVLSVYQLENMDAEDEEGATGDSAEEGLVVLQGIKRFSNNILSVQYKTIPKNALVYRIQSQLESQLQFIQLETPIDEYKPQPNNKTSIGKVVEFWFENFTKVPELSNNFELERTERIDKFIDDLQTFKQEQLSEIDLQIDSKKLNSDFSAMLDENFNQNVKVNQLQYQHTFTKLFINSLNGLKEDNDKLKTYLEQCKLDIAAIERKISIYLKQLIFKFVKDNKIEITNEFDKYLMISNYQRLCLLDIGVKTNIPEKSNFTIGTKFYSETFEVNVDDPIRDDDLLVSITGHGWTTCALSNLPILQMNNIRDELAQFNYIIPDEQFEPGLVTDLLKTINYCYLSGNKTYKLK
ncbi:hypothetical protein JA1_002446 [Spathaspora sp. JA1]|nr:hypothetical protein JA1_002446 [Spathaspora sp. JA1]